MTAVRGVRSLGAWFPLRSVVRFSGGCLWPLLLFCTSDYNPFAHRENAGVVVLWERSGFGHDDTLVLFSTDTLRLAVLVGEQLDSFSVSTPRNRHFADTLIAPVTGNEYGFPLSFVDTGSMVVVLGIARRGAPPVRESYLLRVRSPLHQPDLYISLDSTVVLSTPPVRDSVEYVWCFGDGVRQAFDTVRSPYPLTQKDFSIAGVFPARLWVHRGEHWLSPHVHFTVQLDDRSPPIIVCLNSGLEGGAVIRTGDTELLFEVLVSDRGGVQQVEIGPDVFGPRPGRIYSRLYRELDASPDNLTPVRVRALDRSGNDTTVHFTILHDPEAPGARQGSLTITAVADTVHTGRDEYLLLGTVRDWHRDTLFVSASVGGEAQGDAGTVVLHEGSAPYAAVVRLALGFNLVKVHARDRDGSLRAEGTVTIYRSATFIDTLPPTIVDITAGAYTVQEGARIFTPASSCTLIVRAFDESGIAAVTVNGLSAQRRSGYEWFFVQTSIPRSPPLGVTVTVTDSSAVSSSRTFLLQHNRLPSLSPALIWPSRFFAGVESTFTLVSIDDGEPVTVTFSETPASMRVQRRGVLNQWDVSLSAQEGEIGPWLSTVVLDNGLQSSVYQWGYTVVRDASRLVSFETAAADFPRVLQAGVDTLSVDLALWQGRGSAPFRYTAVLDDGERVLLDTTTTAQSVSLFWVPHPADTGVRVLTAMVRDSLGDRDTLLHEMQVVPRNMHPCTLRFFPPATLAPGGEVDLRTLGEKALQFEIRDHDHPATERFTVVARRAMSETVMTHERAGPFTLTVTANPHRYRDTLVVSLQDRTLTRDTVRVVLLNYLPPVSVRYASGAFLAHDTGELSVEVTDSAGHAFSATLPQGPGALVSTGFNRWSIRWSPTPADSGGHRFPVRLHDGGYRDTTVYLEVFVAPDSSFLPRINAARYPIPSLLLAGTVFLQYVAVEEGRGTPPFNYRVQLDNGIVLFEETMPDERRVIVNWAVSPSAVGERTLMITVRDGNGFADTLFHPLVIAYPNSFPCSLVRRIEPGFDTTGAGELDVRFASRPPWVEYRIVDEDHPLLENYTVTIRQRGVVTVRQFSEPSTFSVVVDTSALPYPDTLVVDVTDATGTRAADTLVVLVRSSRTMHPVSLLGPQVTGAAFTPGEVLDLRTAVQEVTLRYTVHDLDPVGVDRHRVQIRQGNITTVHYLDDIRHFDIALLPRPADRREYDTLVVMVHDLNGSSASDTLHVWYRTSISSAGDIPSLVASFDAATNVAQSGTSVVSWSGGEGSTQYELVPGVNKPSVIENGPGGHPVIRFEGGQQHFFVARTAGVPTIVNWEDAPFTFVFVVRFAVMSFNRRVALVSSGRNDSFEMGVACDWTMGIFNEESQGYCLASQTSGSDLGIGTGEWYILTYRSQTGIVDQTIAVDVTRNGTRAALNPAMTNANSESDGLLMTGAGELGNENGYFRGDMAQWAWYDRALDDAELAELVEMLAHKYHLSIP